MAPTIHKNMPPLNGSEGLISKLHETLGKMELALGSINEAIVWTDTSGQIQWCNSSFDLLVAKPHIAILGQQLQKLLILHKDGITVPPNDHPVQLLIKNEFPITSIFEFHLPDKLIHLEVTGSRASIPQSEDMLILTLRDVTELILSQNKLSKAKEKLEESVQKRTDQLLEISERYKNILNEAVDAIITINQKGLIESFNPAAERIFGYTTNEVMGKNIAILIPPPHRDKHDQYIQKYIKTGVKNIIGIGREVTGVCRNGQIVPLYLAVSEVTTGEQKLFTGILRDISPQKVAEQMLKQARDEAESANRAKSAFLANMSHEIRTPMNAVLGFSEILSTLVTDKEQLRYLHSINAAGKGLLTIINDILDLSKIEAGKLTLHYEMISIRDLFYEIQQMFETETRRKGLEFILDVDPKTPQRLLLDEIRLRQILINLVGNAIKFTSRGYIRITSRLESSTSSSLCDLTFSVEDTGTGIEQDNYDRIFEAFQQRENTSRKIIGGTGLGLTITKRLVEIMGGRISLKSHVGKGSLFTIFLPDTESSLSRQPTMKPNKEIDVLSVSFNPATVLVVDDVASNRDLVRAMLLRTAIKVLEADNGVTGLKTMHSQKPDLILLDIRMPVMDGYTVLRKIKADTVLGRIPVIAITASVNIEEKSKLAHAGFDGILLKPISQVNLITELCRFLPSTKQQEAPRPTANIKKDNAIEATTPPPPELAQTLEKEFLPEWRRFQGVLEMDKIEQFAEQLSTVAAASKTQPLQEFARELNLAASNFQIDTLQELLQRFPDLIDSLRTENT